MQIFLDETGQLTKSKDGDVFLVASFTVGDSKRTEKRFRSWRADRFPKRIRHLSEVKFGNQYIDDSLRLKTLKEISKLDVRIRYGYIKEQNIPLEYRRKGKVRTGHLYTDIVSKTLETYLPITEPDFRVFCDARHLKGLKRPEFKSIVTSNLLSQLPPKSVVQIEMIDSMTSANIQIADWICGALGRYHNNGRLGEECMQILRNNLLAEGVELFKDYWANPPKNSI